jgi:serine protease Do
MLELYKVIISDGKTDMKRLNLKTTLITLVLIVALAVIPVTGCIQITGSEATTPTATTTTTAINPTWTPPTSTNMVQELPDIADVVALVKPAVVAINTETVAYDFFSRPYTEQGAGSGWIIDSSGIIVTNNHVVEGASTVSVTTWDGTTYTADVSKIATDTVNDIAIIKIDAQNLPTVTIGNSSQMRVGDWVIAIGNALGQGIRASEGIISLTDVSLELSQGDTLYDLIETTAAINPGNSGGPLVNLAGEVIGITNAKIADVGIEGMGYAISIDTAAPIIQELINKGYITRPWLGVVLYTVDELAIQQLNLSVDKGVLLTQVSSGSPADQAGLKQWDVVVSIGGQDVTTVKEFTDVLYASSIGQPLEIKYWRGNKEYTTTAVPIESPH